MKRKPYQVTAVEYLNTALFVEGLRVSDLIGQDLELFLDNPAACSRRMMDGSADIGLVPVASLPFIKPKFLLSDFCIGASGPVRTVRLFANSPAKELKKVLLDSHSRTSAKLIEILYRDYWQHPIEFINTEPGFELEDIPDFSGVLAIGDKVFGVENRFEYSYDLAKEWIDFTGTDFVFAVWASHIDLDNEQLVRFKNALSNGLKNRLPIIHKLSQLPKYQGIDIEDYLINNISYPFSSSKRAGMEKFLKLAGFQMPGIEYL